MRRRGPDGQWLPGARWLDRGRAVGAAGRGEVPVVEEEDTCPCYVSVEGLSSSKQAGLGAKTC